MTDYVSEGAFELAGCPQMGGLGEPRTAGYTGGSGGGGSRQPITLQVGDKPEYEPLFYAKQAHKSTWGQNYGGPSVPYAPPFFPRRRPVLGLGTFYINGVGNCVPCGVSGLGAFSIDSLGLGLNIKTLIIVVAAAFAGSWVLRKMKKPRRRNGRVGPRTGYGRQYRVERGTDGLWYAFKGHKPVSVGFHSEKLAKHWANLDRRMANAPFAVKGVFGAIGPARAAYAAMPGGGYKSLIDVNRRKGRSGRYSSRKIVAQHRLPAGSF